MESYLDLTDPLQPQSASVSVETPSNGVLPPHRVPASGGLEPGEAWCLSGPASAVERTEGTIQAFKRPATDNHSVVEDFGPNLSQRGERPALVEVQDRSALPFPGPSAFLQSRVVGLALVAQQPLEAHPLRNGWL
jgi:hypothetical protein